MVLIAANMTGKEKPPLFGIWKNAKPHCFNHVKNLPVDYAANKEAWSCLLTMKAGQPFAMIVDNCPAQADIDNLKAVKQVFLPSNTISILQPCNQKIINNLKRLYKKAVVLSYLVHIDTESPTTS